MNHFHNHHIIFLDYFGSYSIQFIRYLPVVLSIDVAFWKNKRHFSGFIDLKWNASVRGTELWILETPNNRQDIRNYQPLYLFHSLLRPPPTKTNKSSALLIICNGNPPVNRGNWLPSQRASNADMISRGRTGQCPQRRVSGVTQACLLPTWYPVDYLTVSCTTLATANCSSLKI